MTTLALRRSAEDATPLREHTLVSMPPAAPVPLPATSRSGRLDLRVRPPENGHASAPCQPAQAAPWCNPRLRDRRHAGRVLASWLLDYSGRPDVRVLAFPRSLPVALGIAEALTAPLDIFLVHPLGYPAYAPQELGVITSGDVVLLNHALIEALQLTTPELELLIAAERRALACREAIYRADIPAVSILGQTVILVDDGLSTGATMRMAALALRQGGAAHVVAAIPVVPPETSTALCPAVDALVCAMTPEPVGAVSEWYEDLTPLSATAVRWLLAQAARRTVGHRCAPRR